MRRLQYCQFKHLCAPVMHRVAVTQNSVTCYQAIDLALYLKCRPTVPDTWRFVSINVFRITNKLYNEFETEVRKICQSMPGKAFLTPKRVY